MHRHQVYERGRTPEGRRCPRCPCRRCSARDSIETALWAWRQMLLLILLTTATWKECEALLEGRPSMLEQLVGLLAP